MTVFTDMDDALFTNDDIAVDATYKADGVGVGTSVRVILSSGSEVDDIGASQSTRTAVLIDVRASDVATPDIGDTFTIGSDVYTVDNMPDSDGQVHQLSVRKS